MRRALGVVVKDPLVGRLGGPARRSHSSPGGCGFRSRPSAIWSAAFVRVTDDQTDNVVKPCLELIVFAGGVDRYRRGDGSCGGWVYTFSRSNPGVSEVLTIVRSIIENQGGRILCRADSPRANLESYFCPLKRIVHTDKSSRRR